MYPAIVNSRPLVIAARSQCSPIIIWEKSTGTWIYFAGYSSHCLWPQLRRLKIDIKYWTWMMNTCQRAIAQLLQGLDSQENNFSSRNKNYIFLFESFEGTYFDFAENIEIVILCSIIYSEFASKICCGRVHELETTCKRFIWKFKRKIILIQQTLWAACLS